MGYLIDRTFFTYLEPPDAQPATCRLGAAIDENDTSITLGGFALIEDEDLLRAECMLEIAAELILVTSYDDTTGIATVDRGDTNGLGTTSASHPLGARVKIAPPFARVSVREALADNIITLYPDLYQVDVANLSTVGGNVAAIDDPLAVEVVEVWNHMHSVVDTDARIVDFHPAVAGRAVIIGGGLTGNFWIRYRKRFGSSTSEADTYEDLGLEARWATIVMVGACADLFIGRDIPASVSSFIQGTLEAENVPIGTRLSMGQQMASYRQRLLHEAKQEMRAEYKAKQSRVQVVNTGWF